ncbi:MAG: hypothetical protein KJ067_16690 [Vicinamibacteria bacterium]|nr:hypothetical protein [Vicinamibacteria bacterium]
MSRRTPRPGTTPRAGTPRAPSRAGATPRPRVAGQVRGVVVMNALAFLRERHGAGALDQVLKDLPAARRGAFGAHLREASWEPLADFVAWLEAAQQRFAPGDPGFARELGAFAGSRERKAGGYGPMVATPEAAMRMGQVLWRTIYDVGRLEVERLEPLRCLVRIRDFPCQPLLWQRTVGAFEGLLSTPELRARATPLRCTSQGDECCEMEVEWLAFSPGS